MKSLASVLSFRPTLLPEARENAVALHPSTSSRPPTLGPTEVAALKLRVGEAANAAHPKEALIALAHALAERELLAVVRAIGDWTDLREAVATIARARVLPRYVPVLWRLWQSFPALEPLVEILTEMVALFGPDRLVRAPYVDDALGWLQDDHPIDAIVQWTGHREIAWRELPEIPELPFEADTPLMTRVFHRTLQIGSREQLVQMEQETVIAGWQQMSGERHMEACANYIERTEPSMWPAREKVLEEVRDSYGIPPDPESFTVPVQVAVESIPTFWERVSDKRRDDFRQYFIAVELGIAFKGDSTPDRRDFWMSQRRSIISVCHGTAGNTRWSLIDFPGFSVVEFFEVGNAAYLYPAYHPIVQRIRSRSQFAWPEDLKERSHHFGPPGDNRIIHRGDWQRSAHLTLKVWKKHSS